MTLYPRVMKKAQAELDAIVGTTRLPTFADRPSLPYMEALFTELLRWHTPGPTSMFCLIQSTLSKYISHSHKMHPDRRYV